MKAFPEEIHALYHSEGYVVLMEALVSLRRRKEQEVFQALRHESDLSAVKFKYGELNGLDLAINSITSLGAKDEA
jgi:hypothetical protein